MCGSKKNNQLCKFSVFNGGHIIWSIGHVYEKLKRDLPGRSPTLILRNNIKKEIKTLEEICGKKHIELFDIELIIDDYHSNFNMDKLSRKHEYIYSAEWSLK